MEKYYSAREVADMLGLTKQAVILRIWRGKVKAIRVDSQYIIPKNEVTKLLKGRKK